MKISYPVPKRRQDGWEADEVFSCFAIVLTICIMGGLAVVLRLLGE